ncbi:MAG: 2TM domain-containing protein [Candidatus Margulisbacteria bacterium]|jgi:hypothetical protein|nr:2TM domain-containing protein [Candidatus Margulisiibacteriota bacterium]
MPDTLLKNTLWGFFCVHALLFAAANLALILLNLLVYPGVLWFFYPLFFWLLLLILHYALNKLILSGFLRRGWDSLLDRLDR